MHLLRGNYGLHGAAAGAQDAGPSGATGTLAGGGGRAGGRPLGTASTSNLRPSAGVADSDDVDDILKQVRRDVAAIQHQSAPTALEEEPASSSGSRRPPGPPTTRQLNRSQSEATWDRPKTREREEDIPRALPKSTVRGRYVFSGGAETQVLTGNVGRGADSSAPDYTTTEFASHFSPRPMAPSSNRTASAQHSSRRSRGMAGPHAGQIPEGTESEVVHSDGG